MLRIGDKVIPISKTCLEGLDGSSVWMRAKKKNQAYLFIVGLTHYRGREVYVLNDILSGGGDYFHPEDIVMYVLNKGR